MNVTQFELNEKGRILPLQLTTKILKEEKIVLSNFRYVKEINDDIVVGCLKVYDTFLCNSKSNL